MSDRKVSNFTFEDDRKVKLVERLRKLMGRHNSARAAARFWGLSFSTINNYVNRGTEPSFFAIQSIATKENVSLDWLAYGSLDPNEGRADVKNESDRQENSYNKNTWNKIFESISPDDQALLVNLFIREGVKGVIAALSITEDVNKKFINFPHDEKVRLLRLHEEIKKGAPEGSEEVTLPNQPAEERKVG